MTPAPLPGPDALRADGPRPVPRALLWLVVLAAIVARWPSLSAGFLNYDDPQIRAEVAAKSPLVLLTSVFAVRRPMKVGLNGGAWMRSAK